MARFGRRSRRRLELVDERLGFLFRRVVVGFDCTILVGARGRAGQEKARREGHSTKAWPRSKHNIVPPGAGSELGIEPRLRALAVDVAPWPLVWGGALIDPLTGELDDANVHALERFRAFGGYVLGVAFELGIGVRWGGDWDRDWDLRDQRLIDLVHFEII